MKDRCHGRHRADYAELDIDFPKAWNTFAVFLQDMGECPEGMTLERKDNNKGYSKDNCCWATRLQQARNRSDTVMSEEKVRLLKELWKTKNEGITRAIFIHLMAERFSCSKGAIKNVLAGVTWKEVC